MKIEPKNTGDVIKTDSIFLLSDQWLIDEQTDNYLIYLKTITWLAQLLTQDTRLEKSP